MLEGILPKKNKIEVLSREQIAKIYKVCNNQETIMLLIGLNTGINREELKIITKADVNLSGCTIYVRGEKKSRMTYISPSASSRLKTPLAKLNGSVEAMMEYSEDDYKKIMDKWSAIAGIELSWQNIRHTYAELAAQEGLPIKLVAHNIGVEEKTLNGHFDLTPAKIAVILRDKMIQ